MSHNIRYATYSENIDKSKVQAEWDDFVRHEDWQEGASGLGQPIRWSKEPPLEDYEKAREYIEKHDSGWYDQLAVRYYETPRITTKKYLALQDKVREAYKKYDEAESKIHYKDAKCEFVGCKNCGSKLNRERLVTMKTNKCPMCRNDLRPETTLNRIEKLRENLFKCRNAVSVEEKKAKRTEIKWLVKIEYHT